MLAEKWNIESKTSIVLGWEHGSDIVIPMMWKSLDIFLIEPFHYC